MEIISRYSEGVVFISYSATIMCDQKLMPLKSVAPKNTLLEMVTEKPIVIEEKIPEPEKVLKKDFHFADVVEKVMTIETENEIIIDEDEETSNANFAFEVAAENKISLFRKKQDELARRGQENQSLYLRRVKSAPPKSQIEAENEIKRKKWYFYILKENYFFSIFFLLLCILF